MRGGLRSSERTCHTQLTWPPRRHDCARQPAGACKGSSGTALAYRLYVFIDAFKGTRKAVSQHLTCIGCPDPS